MTTSYAFDPCVAGELERLRAGEALLDPGTHHVLEELGLSAGWRCLEVGAGAGAIAAWLRARVGPSGRVIATDRSPRFLDGLLGVEVWSHEITTEPLPVASFDLVHARLLLEHLTDRNNALARMVGAAVPGGWVVVEAFDFVSQVPATPAPAFEATCQGVLRFLEAHGLDSTFGRKLPAALAAAGLVDIEAAGRVLYITGGSLGARWLQLTFEALGPRAVESGLVTATALEAALAALKDPGFACLSPALVAARGRRPG